MDRNPQAQSQLPISEDRSELASVEDHLPDAPVDSTKLVQGEHKSCQTEDLPTLSDHSQLLQTANVRFGINIYDDSPQSKFFLHLFEMIIKLEAQGKQDRQLLDWYQNKYGLPEPGLNDRS